MRTLHLGLRVTDAEQSISFYAALGYEVLGSVPGTELGDLTMLKLPDDEFVALELAQDPSLDHVDPSGLSALVVNVDNVRETVDQLATRGIAAEEPHSPNGSEDFWTAWLTDPDGYRIELVQWPTGHPAGMTQADLAGPG